MVNILVLSFTLILTHNYAYVPILAVRFGRYDTDYYARSQYYDDADGYEELPYVTDWRCNSERTNARGEWFRADEARTVFMGRDDVDSFFKTKGSRTHIDPNDLYQLRHGDHIGWHRPYVIWRHKIVLTHNHAYVPILAVRFGRYDTDYYARRQYYDVTDVYKELPYVTDWRCNSERTNARREWFRAGNVNPGDHIGWHRPYIIWSHAILLMHNHAAIPSIAEQFDRADTDYCERSKYINDADLYEELPYATDWRYDNERTLAIREWFSDDEARTEFTGRDDVDSAFQTKGSRTPIDHYGLYKLRPGDHIGWHRPYIIWHHAIVVSVDPSVLNIVVIHYSKDRDRKLVVKATLNFDAELGACYRFDYAMEDNFQNSTDTVLERAHAMIGEEGYNFFNNNCETMATYCKTGKKGSTQTRWAAEKLKTTVMMSIVTAACRASFWEAFGFVAVCEAGYCGHDLDRLKINRDRGNMTETDFRVSSNQRVSEAFWGVSLAIVGDLLGGCLGSYIPVVGYAVGSLIGSVVGGTIGSILGKAIDSLFGNSFGNTIW